MVSAATLAPSLPPTSKPTARYNPPPFPGPNLFSPGPSHSCPYQLTNPLQLQLLFEAAWGASILPIKLSILLLYYRIFPLRTYYVWAWILGAFSIAWTVTVVLTSCLQCTPIAYFWDQSIPGGRCINGPASYFVEAILNFGSDVCLLVLPFPMVMRLKVGRAQKWGLCGVFCLGGMCVLPNLSYYTSLIPKY